MKEVGDKIKEVGDKTTEVGKGLSIHYGKIKRFKWQNINSQYKL